MLPFKLKKCMFYLSPYIPKCTKLATDSEHLWFGPGRTRTFWALKYLFLSPPLLDHRNISSQHLLRKILSAGSLLSVSESFCSLATISPSPPFTGSHWTQHFKICIMHIYLILYRYVLTHFPIIDILSTTICHSLSIYSAMY